MCLLSCSAWCCGLDLPVPVPQRLGVQQGQAACKEVGGLGYRGGLQGARAAVSDTW